MDRQPAITGLDEFGVPDSIATDRFFAATWTGYVSVNTAGTYTFFINIGILDSATLLVRPEGADDDAWVTVINLDCATEPNSGSVYLDAGVYEILVRYSDYGFTDCMQLEWSGPDTNGNQQPLDEQLLPNENCFEASGGPGKDDIAGPGTGGLAFSEIRHHY